jgi:hypothetical protein
MRSRKSTKHTKRKYAHTHNAHIAHTVVRQHLVVVLHLREQSVTRTGTGAACATTALVGVCLRNRSDLQCVHSNARIVHFDLAEGAVHSVETELHIDREICVRRVQRTSMMNVTRAVATYT